MLEAGTALRFVKGVGPRRADRLAEQGLETVEDLLYVLPFRYDDRRSFGALTDLAEGGPDVTLSVEVRSARLIRTRNRGFTIFRAELFDDGGAIRGVWYNQPFLERLLVPGRKVLLYGHASVDRYGERVLDNPEYEFVDEDDAEGIHTGRIVPVYRKLADLPSRALRRLTYRALADLDPRSLLDLVPVEVRRRHDLPSRLEALRHVHFPADDADSGELEKRQTDGQRALAFEEIFLLQLALALRQHGLRQEGRTIRYESPDALRTGLAGKLPFRLTGAQERVLREIGNDLSSDHPMGRLLQGDVGSGKTIVALLALLVAIENGYQGALMAPTEILAEQHLRNLRNLLDGGGVDCRVTLLTGSLRAAARRQVLAEISSGTANLVVGTHALFEAGVEFSRLGLAVIDEQHRFGVLQRAALARKGTRPDILVMTATPIPRSLAMTLYGDLDLSVIDELPPGRTPVRTHARTEADRAKVYRFVRAEVAAGRQVYVVVPLVEESAKVDLKAATEFAERLRQRELAGIEVGLLHGRMKGEEKERVMRAFRAAEVRVLVATTVIEVGVDIPNATVMVVEHAERFGLSQLHQLRGRVGRGADRSYCILMVGGDGTGREAAERLAVMERTTDGFRIAEADLQLRGPGALFGTQQHGLSDLQFLADVLRNPALLESARQEARAMVGGGDGPRRRARSLLESLGPRWQRRFFLAEVG